MLIAASNFIIGFACGLRLTLLAFVTIMLAILASVAVLSLREDTVVAAMAQVALAALCLQAGYVGGVFLRARHS